MGEDSKPQLSGKRFLLKISLSALGIVIGAAMIVRSFSGEAIWAPLGVCAAIAVIAAADLIVGERPEKRLLQNLALWGGLAALIFLRAAL